MTDNISAQFQKIDFLEIIVSTQRMMIYPGLDLPQSSKELKYTFNIRKMLSRGKELYSLQLKCFNSWVHLRAQCVSRFN